MNDVRKMLRAIINGQSALKQDLLKGINKNRKEIMKNRNRIGEVGESLTKRIDKLGLDLAELSDDTLTRDEHDELIERVEKVEQKTASV